MGMSIDKAIDIMENYEEYGFLSQENGRNKAINIMRKYQKIEHIIKSEKIPYKLDLIEKVVEDGKIG